MTVRRVTTDVLPPAATTSSMPPESDIGTEKGPTAPGRGVIDAQFHDRQRSDSPRSRNSPVVPNAGPRRSGSAVRSAAPARELHGRTALSSSRRCHSPWSATYSQSTHAQRVDNPGDNWGPAGTTGRARTGMHTTAELSQSAPGLVHVADTRGEQRRRPAVPTVHTPDCCYGNISPRELFRRHSGDGSLPRGAERLPERAAAPTEPSPLLESHVHEAVPWDAPSRRRTCVGRCPLPVVAHSSLEDRR